jgi:integrase
MAKRGQPDLVAYLLGGGGVTRHQDPKLQVRKDVPRPYFYIRPVVPVRTEAGIVRKQRRVPLGFLDEMTAKQAKVAKEEYMATVNAGKTLLQAQVPFERVVQLFEEGAMPLLASSTRGKYTHYITKCIRPAFAKKLMHQVGTQEIQVLVNNAKLGWWAKQDLRNCMSAIFTHAKTIGLWSEPNPCEGVKCGRKSTVREKKIPRGDQLAAFLDALADTKICSAEEARLMVLTAVVAGLRVSEVLGLQIRDLDVQDQTVTVRRRWHRGDLGEPKSESSRRTRPVGPLAVELASLGLHRAKDAFLFAREDGRPPDDRDLQQHVFRPAAEKAGIYHPGFGMHTFRRLNISWRQEAGATPFEAMRAAGHANVSTTWLYTVTDGQREKDQVEKLWKRVKKA